MIPRYNFKELMLAVHTNPNYVKQSLISLQQEFNKKNVCESYVTEKIISLCKVMRDWNIAMQREGYENINIKKWDTIIYLLQEND